MPTKASIHFFVLSMLTAFGSSVSKIRSGGWRIPSLPLHFPLCQFRVVAPLGLCCVMGTSHTDQLTPSIRSVAFDWQETIFGLAGASDGAAEAWGCCLWPGRGPQVLGTRVGHQGVPWEMTGKGPLGRPTSFEDEAVLRFASWS
mmetsp:Transcript_25708/g.44272  ORF Transcript_25708/g.44272 Transcript_25708/m.44272 type:complete len:144 (-) Transcript_25708:377-808(-)